MGLGQYDLKGRASTESKKASSASELDPCPKAHLQDGGEKGEKNKKTVALHGNHHSRDLLGLGQRQEHAMLGPLQRDGVLFSPGKRQAPELHSIIKKCRHLESLSKNQL